MGIRNVDWTAKGVRNVNWIAFGEWHMPAPEFVVDILMTWDAIAWERWKFTEITFAGETRTAEKWQDEMHKLFNEAETAMLQKLKRKRLKERGCL